MSPCEPTADSRMLVQRTRLGSVCDGSAQAAQQLEAGLALHKSTQFSFLLKTQWISEREFGACGHV